MALYNINVDELVGERGRLLAQGQAAANLGWTLAAVAGAERIATILVNSPMLDMAGYDCWLLFVLYVTLSELRSVLKQREVTGETICMAMSVYLLLGFTWAFLYALCFRCIRSAFARHRRSPAIRSNFSTFSRFSATSA